VIIGGNNMVKRIETRLNCMIDWLEKESIEYSREEFKKDVERMQDAINEALFIDLITDKQYSELTELVKTKSIKYFLNKSN
jgi:hypothetical protein